MPRRVSRTLHKNVPETALEGKREAVWLPLSGINIQTGEVAGVFETKVK